MQGPTTRRGLIVLGSAASRWRPARMPAISWRPRRPTARCSRTTLSAHIWPSGLSSLAACPICGGNGLPRWFADRGYASRTSAVAGDSRLTSIRRSTASSRDSPGSPRRRPGQAAATPDPFGLVRATLERIPAVARDPSAELLVAGRTSARSLRWLDTRPAAAPGCWSRSGACGRRNRASGRPGQSWASSSSARGHAAFGALLADLADAAVIDSRVLPAHRLGNDESAWPSRGDRFASDPSCTSRSSTPAREADPVRSVRLHPRRARWAHARRAGPAPALGREPAAERALVRARSSSRRGPRRAGRTGR